VADSPKMSSAMEGLGGGGAPSARRRRTVCISGGIRAGIDRESGRRAARVRTVPLVPKTRVLHVRVEPSDLAVWRVVAATRGRTLGELVRELLAGAAAEGVTVMEEGVGAWLPLQQQPARAGPSLEELPLEERLAAIEALVAGLGRSSG
jgi:hypothetical protein